MQTRRRDSVGPTGPPASAGGSRRAARESGSIGGIASPFLRELSRRSLLGSLSRALPEEVSHGTTAHVAESLHRGVASAMPFGERRRFPADLAAIARHEVLERIGSGQSSIGGRRPAHGVRDESLAPLRVPVTPMEDDGWRKPFIPWLESTRLIRVAASLCFRLRVRAQALASGSETRLSLGSGSSRCDGRCGGWGPNPIGSLLPAQRKLDASDRCGRSEIGRTVVVLTSCSDCRGRRETPGRKLSSRGGWTV